MWGAGRPPDPWPRTGVGAGLWVLGGGEGGLREAALGHSLCSALPSARPQLPNQSELRAPTAEKAALYLDAALAARSARRPGCSSHLLFTLHVYQYRVEKCGRGGSRCRLATPPPPWCLARSAGSRCPGAAPPPACPVLSVSGGRSRLHLIDLGGCEGAPSRGGEAPGGSSCLPLLALGSVILALVSGAKHVPYR